MKPVSSTVTNMNIHHPIEQSEQQDHPSSPSSSAVDSTCEPSSSLFFTSRSDTSRFPPELVGDEEQCRHKFAKMVKSAYTRQLERQKEYSGSSNIPRDIEIVFDDKSNIEWIRFSIRGEREQHRFCG